MTITNRDPNLKSEGNCQMRGRKPQLTPEIQALIAHHIKSGIGVKATAEATNISLPTLTRWLCLLYTSPSPRDGLLSRMPSSA